MSADNAIMILGFPDDTYMVKHVCNPMEISPNDSYINSELLYNEFDGCEILEDKNSADIVAIQLLQEYWYVEYGIILLKVPLEWKSVRDLALTTSTSRSILKK